MLSSFKSSLRIIGVFLLALSFFACSKEEPPMRTPDKIEGIWSPDETHYYEFGNNNNVRFLTIEYQDGESIGIWTEDAYFYEAGYNLVIYMNSDHQAMVYQIVELNQNRLVWCWVKQLQVESREDISKAIGEVIKEAQEGFKLNPERYETFNKISEDEFLSLLEKLDLMYPW